MGNPATWQQNLKKITDAMISSPHHGSPAHQFSAKLVHLQINLLLAIATETQSGKSQVGPPTSFWLGSAVGLAYFLKIYLYKQPEPSTANDPDSEDKLARRLWWSLVAMDRWHSSSTSIPLLIPDSSVVLHPDDQVLLGDPLWNFARRSPT
jgi:hypothetical protein